MTIEYNIQAALYDLKSLINSFETYAEMLAEYEILKRDGVHSAMHEQKTHEQYKRAINTALRIRDYLETRKEITEAEKLLYIKV